MSIRLQFVLIIGTMFIIYSILRMIKKGTLQLKYSLLWILIALVMIILTIFPGILYKISNMMGIFVPTNTLFLLGMLFELMILFSLTVALSKASDRIKNLTQYVALLKKETEEILQERSLK